MHVLVTGSAGLVGRELAARLRADGHRVTDYDIVDGVSDIRDRGRLSAALRGCDGAVHLAAVARSPGARRTPISACR